MANRCYEWSQYLQNNFNLSIRWITPDSGDWARARFHCSLEEWNGMYFPGEHLIFINHARYGTGRGFRTMIHELGHHLCHTGKLTYKGNAFVRRYFREVDFKVRFHAYDKWALEEEMIVDCLAQWAVDWGDNYEVNKGFKDFLASLCGNPPPF
jgi:hypothetical protein